MSTKITDYVKEGFTKVVEMKRLLKIFIKNDIFNRKNLPDQINRSFYPRSKIIPTAMCRAMKTLRKSMIDQECLIAKIEQWKAEDPSAKLYFRPKCDSNVEDEGESFENSNIEDVKKEIQLKGIFFRTKLLQVLLARNFYHWSNVMPSKTSTLLLEH